MKLTIQSLHFTSSAALNDFITEKVNKLSRFSDRIESAAVSLKLDKSDKTENKICEIRLAVPGNDLFVKRQCKTFEEAGAEAVDILHQQLQKMKTKSAHH